MTAVEYQVRDARITDAERITALLEAGRGRHASNARATLGAADLTCATRPYQGERLPP